MDFFSVFRQFKLVRSDTAKSVLVCRSFTTAVDDGTISFSSSNTRPRKYVVKYEEFSLIILDTTIRNT